MAKKKELSADLRLPIETANKGEKAMSKQFIVPVATVNSIMKRYKKSSTISNIEGRGQKSKVSPHMAKKVW